MRRGEDVVDVEASVWLVLSALLEATASSMLAFRSSVGVVMAVELSSCTVSGWEKSSDSNDSKTSLLSDESLRTKGMWPSVLSW